MKSFKTEATTPREIFELDGYVYHGAADMPAAGARALAKMVKASDAEKMVYITDFLDTVLIPEDAEQFAKVMLNTERSVSIKLLSEIIEATMEEYAERPTMRPVPSANGQTSTGSSSTAGVQDEA